MFPAGKIEMKIQPMRLRFARCLLVAAAVMAFTRMAEAIVPWAILINTNNVIVVTNIAYGAVADNVTTNTTAIQNAINAAATGGTTNGLIGGTVEIPAGTNAYLCGPITLKNNVNLQIDGGAILRMLPLTVWPMTWITNGANYWFTNTPNFISGNSLTNIEISGSGAVDGQGAPWWPYSNTNNAVRAVMISLNGCNQELIQNVTLSNSPMFHIAIGGSAKNSTVQGVTVFAPASSPNTDACDVSGTNTLVQNCNISEGDDDFTCGGGTHDVLLTNNTYGTGHGISIGSYTDSGGVSNITVVNCTISGAVNGIRIKSDNNRGGLVQNINYLNIGITNVNFPIQVYAYYNWYGTPSGITPQIAASTNAATVSFSSGGGTPIYRNITFSNITATSVGSYPAVIIWARTEMPATNIVFNRVNVSASRPFEIYNASGVQLTDSQVSGNNTNLWLFNAQVIITNSSPATNLFTFDGLTTNGYGNTFAFYNAQASLKNTNVFDDGPLTLSASKLTVSNNLALIPTTTLNYILGTNAATVSVISNLMLGGTIKFANGVGFTNGTYTLLTYAGSLKGNLPALTGNPAGFNYVYSLNTNTLGQVNLLAQSPPSPVVTSFILSAGGGFIFNVTNGPPSNSVFYVLATTNLADGTWTPVATNQFNGSGQILFTNAAGPAAPQTFYLLELP
jgi:polygalacturonase